MKLEKKARGFILKINSEEMHDLLTIAEVPGDILGTALKSSRREWVDKEAKIQTHGVYRLLNDLKDQEGKLHVRKV
jgi:hypothetical protein